MGGPRTREKGQAERPGGGGAGSPSGRSAGAEGAGSRGRGALRGPGESARTPGGPGERPGSRGWRAAATYLLVRDPRRLLQAEGAAVGAVLRHHAQAAGRAHQLLGVAARGHLGGHDAAGALARCPPPAARGPQPGPSPSGAPPRPASVADSARVQSPSQAQSTDQSVLGIRPAAACSNRGKGTSSAPAAGHQWSARTLPSTPRPLGATETSDWPVSRRRGLLFSSDWRTRLGAPCAHWRRGSKGWGGAKELAERGRGEDAGWPLRSRSCRRPGWPWTQRPLGRGQGPAGRPRGPAAGIRGGGRLAPTQCPDRRCAAADGQEGPRSQGPRGSRAVGGGRADAEQGWDRGPRSRGGEPAQLQGLLGLCVRAGGAGWGAEGGVGSGSERARWEAQVCVGGRARLQRPLVCQDGPGGGLLDMQPRGTGE